MGKAGVSEIDIVPDMCLLIRIFSFPFSGRLQTVQLWIRRGWFLRIFIGKYLYCSISRVFSVAVSLDSRFTEFVFHCICVPMGLSSGLDALDMALALRDRTWAGRDPHLGFGTSGCFWHMTQPIF